MMIRSTWHIAVVGALLLLAGCETSTPRTGAADGAVAGGSASSGAREPSEAQGVRGTPSGEGADAAPLSSEVRPGTGRFVGAARGGEAGAGGAGGDITLNFVDADIREVAMSVLGDILKLNYLIDPKVRGNVTIHTSRPLTRDDLLPVLETILNDIGASLVQVGDLYKVVPSAEATRQASSIRVGRSPALRGRGFGVQVVPLRYIAADEMAKVIEPLAPKGSILRVDPVRNLIVLAASRPDLDAILDAIDIFDVDWVAGMSFGLFPLQFADAKALAEDLGKVLADDGGNRPAGLFRFVPIERLNAVLVITPQRRYLEHAEEWIERLDRGGEGVGQRLFVYNVKNGKAADLAAILSQIFADDKKAATPLAGDVAPHLAAADIGSRAAAAGPTGATGNGGTAQPAVPGAQAAPGAGARPGAAAGGNTAFTARGKEEIRIIADEANNAIVVLAAPADHQLIKAALDKLDVIPLQVLIEATIAEVTLNDDLEFGIQWFLEKGDSQFTFSDLATGAVAPVFPGFSYFFNAADARVTLNALSEVTDVNVISTPQVMVLGNKTATLQVGDQVPIAIQSAVSVTDPSAPIVNSIEFRDTGVILKVTPRVNPGGLVFMEIEQEVSDVVATTTSGIDSPTIQQRQIASTVAVQSGQTVALGGLIRESKTNSRTGIPLLSEIPILGALFGKTVDDKRRTELLVLITPRVIRDQEDARRITEEMRRRMRAVVPLEEKIGTLNFGTMDGPGTAAAPAAPPRPAPPAAAGEEPARAAPLGPAPPAAAGQEPDTRAAPDAGRQAPAEARATVPPPAAAAPSPPPPPAAEARSAAAPVAPPQADIARPSAPPAVAPATEPSRAIAERPAPPAPAAEARARPQPAKSGLPTPTEAPLRPASLATGAPAASAPPPLASAIATEEPTNIFVQAGAFRRQDNADQVAQRLAQLGAVWVTAVEVDGAPYYRVRLGPLPTIEEGERLLTRVVAAGHPGARLVVY